MKRTSSIAILAIFGIIALGSMAYAGPGMGMRGDCAGWNQNSAVQQLPQEKQDLLKNILDEHRKDTQPLRNAMWEKRTLLKALSSNPNTKPEAITALVGEMSELRGQMQANRDALQDRVSKEVGIDLPMGMGKHGRHGKGGRGGFGHGGQGGFGQRGMGQGMNPALDATPAEPGA
jgi:zinc resistance-associated protein